MSKQTIDYGSIDTYEIINTLCTYDVDYINISDIIILCKNVRGIVYELIYNISDIIIMRKNVRGIVYGVIYSLGTLET